MKKFSRRDFVKSVLVGSSILFLPNISLSKTSNQIVKRLSFRNLHTNELLENVTFFERGKYLASGLNEISYILRDHRANEVKEIDPKLLNILFNLKTRLNYNDNFQIISGYRSPQTNHHLRLSSKAVAENSYHMHGQAIDIAFANLKLSKARDIAKSLKSGGVGYYPKTGFIHIDTGKVRYWG